MVWVRERGGGMVQGPLEKMSRAELQALAKKHGLKANMKSADLISLLRDRAACSSSISRGEAGAARDPGEKGRERAAVNPAPWPAKVAVAVAMVAVTGTSYYQEVSSTVSPPLPSSDSGYMAGLGFAGLALVGNAAVSAFRKVLSNRGVGSAQQVGLACLIQGIFAIISCVRSGEIEISPATGMPALPPPRFWVAAAAANSLLSLVKMLETRAYSECDMSLCAPFLAFDPVMQLLVGVVFMPAACSLVGLGCEDGSARYPAYHLASLACVAYGAFLLGSASGKAEGKVRYVGPLPIGSWFILLNCVIYGFTSRMDRVAIKASSKTVYYAFGRCLMAATALGGSYASGGFTWKEVRKLLSPAAALLLLCVCLADALYQLSQYQAMSYISPVYVTAVKRGGGILLSALMGVLLFGEQASGRILPTCLVVYGVVFLCL